MNTTELLEKADAACIKSEAAEREFAAQVKRMREASGNIESVDPLVTFFYVLIRDHLPGGLVEEILRTALDQAPGTVIRFCNGWVANYAKDIVDRLRARHAMKAAEFWQALTAEQVLELLDAQPKNISPGWQKWELDTEVSYVRQCHDPRMPVPAFVSRPHGVTLWTVASNRYSCDLKGGPFTTAKEGMEFCDAYLRKGGWLLGGVIPEEGA